jgi:apolipoprotein N-acyltransferase
VIVCKSLIAVFFAYEMQRLAPGPYQIAYAVIGLIVAMVSTRWLINSAKPEVNTSTMKAGGVIIITVAVISMFWVLANIGTFVSNFIYLIVLTIYLGFLMYDASILIGA